MSLTYIFLFGYIRIIIITPPYKVIDITALSLYIKMLQKRNSTVAEMY